jgi:hypothetical protein
LCDGDLDFTIARLGECRYPSPLSGDRFTRDDQRVRKKIDTKGTLWNSVLASTGQPWDMS